GPCGHIIEQPTGTISQRQRERNFQKWLGITPKHYQRIKRVKHTLEQLRAQPDLTLSELALEQGFSDQAHMTRECKQIARMTPKQYVRKRNL
ncbi:helix-turn-helix domain-containing protein, partial [Vibrio alginolyticus]|uniref:helix-turn-helix domain-containing protein n=1 Tax=Vibrio alginolyticus TaxID=663 RepID=UPI0038CD8B6F